VSEDFDLFGNPYIAEPPRRGRPPHAVTKETRNRVSMLVALGWANPRIAGVLGVTLPTLRKHYFFELRQRDVARDKLEARRIEMAWQLAESGNVAALREFGRLLDRNDLMDAEAKFAADKQNESKATDKPRGKKEIDRVRALEADADLMRELDAEAAGSSNAIN
jgi:hypothetical protein